MPIIGIFAGTFDPVHNGHIAFANAAIEKCGLSKVIFLPERQPRYKTAVTAFKHRLAMLETVVATQPLFEVLPLPDRYFTVSATWLKLQKRYSGNELALLIGADTAAHISLWPDSKLLYASATFIVGARKNVQMLQLSARTCFVATEYDYVSSSDIRSGVHNNIPPSIFAYMQRHKLYAVY